MRLFFYTIVTVLLASRPVVAVPQDVVEPSQVITAPFEPSDPVGLKVGMEENDLRKLYGPPDRVSSGVGSGVESWFYGSSMLVLNGGVLAAWSDRGDLEERKVVQPIDLAPAEPAPSFQEQGWLNPWTPESEIDSARVLDEIVNSY